MVSNATLAEILERVEKKVDTTNGSVAKVMERTTALETSEAVRNAQIRMLSKIIVVLAVPVVINVLNFLTDGVLARLVQ